MGYGCYKYAKPPHKQEVPVALVQIENRSTIKIFTCKCTCMYSRENDGMFKVVLACAWYWFVSQAS